MTTKGLRLRSAKVDWFGLMVFNATFNSISVIPWRSVLLVKETGGPGENHRPVASHWQTLHVRIVHPKWSCDQSNRAWRWRNVNCGRFMGRHARIPWWWRRLIIVRVLMWPPNAKLPRSAPAVLNGRLDMGRSSLAVLLRGLPARGWSVTFPVWRKRCISRTMMEWLTPKWTATLLWLKPPWCMPPFWYG